MMMATMMMSFGDQTPNQTRCGYFGRAPFVRRQGEAGHCLLLRPLQGPQRGERGSNESCHVPPLWHRIRIWLEQHSHSWDMRHDLLPTSMHYVLV